MFASVTRLRVRSLKFLPVFIWRTFLTQRQVVRAPGFSGGRVLVDVHRTFWTLSLWESEQAMKAFRGSGSHAAVMPHLVRWCDEASYAHWNPVSVEVPTWLESYEYLLSHGRLSHVEHPSEEHKARRFPPPRLSPLIGQNLTPVRGS